jgi:putative transposase
MPRASRYYIPGYVWHITHRCHKKEFLLRFGRDRRRWLKWLFEAGALVAIVVAGNDKDLNHPSSCTVSTSTLAVPWL